MAKSRQAAPASGVYAALATPRRSDSSQADTAALLDYIDLQLSAGVDGLVLFGATGEFVHFDIEERMHLLSFALRRSRVPVLVNVSHSTLAGATALAQDAVAGGASGLLVMPPYFYRYNQQQLFSFYREFSRAVDNRALLYLYNLPIFTNPISAELAEQLLASGAFAGIKDSSGDPEMLHALQALRLRHAFSLLVGNESLYLQARTEGADGIVSGVAAALPELIVALDRAILTGDLQRARSLNSRLAEFLEWVDKFPATVAIKQAAVARGWKLDHFAFPLDESTSTELLAYHHWLQSWLPSVLTECAAGLTAVKA